MSLLGLVIGTALLPRAVVFGSALVLVPWFTLCATIARDAGDRAEQRHRVVLVASSEEARALSDDLATAAERRATVVATLDAVLARSVAGSRPLVEIAERERANVIVLDREAQADADVVEQAALLHANGIRVRTLSLFYEQWLGKLPMSELERVSLLFDIGELHSPGYARVKRLVDVALASLGLLALTIVLPLVLLGNLLGNRGTVFFRQSRVGRDGVAFEMLKFRSMRAAAPGDGYDWTGERDNRITRFGAVLRRSHLDELPQVLNILRGDLSIVGPRPEQPRYVEELTHKIPFYGIRHLVRPGLTGWAQVKYQYAGTEAETLEKLQYEFFYLRRQSVGLDLRIVARTLRAVLGGEGR